MLTVNEIKLQYNTPANKQPQIKVSTSNDAHKAFRENWIDSNMEICECFYLMLLSKSGHIKGISRLSVGGMSGTVVDKKLVFATALKGLAAGIIVCHNHPSGNLKPSEADVSMTRDLRDGCRLLDIALMDHLILSPFGGYYSFADEGAI